MRPEKKYLLEEIGTYLDKSDYFFLADYNTITVEETAVLRAELSKHDAEFHVIKNNILNVVTKQREMPDLSEYLNGPTAIVMGGNNAPGVAKALGEFFKKNNKVEVKGGVLENRAINPSDVVALSKLPSLDVIKSMFLSLLNTPATQMVRVAQAGPQSFVYLLNARSDQLKEGEAN